MFNKIVVGTCAALIAATTLTANAEVIYGVTQQQTLVSWESAAPGTLLTGMAISGLQQNEVVLGIDMRPSTGVIYALGRFNRLYTINRIAGGFDVLLGTQRFELWV